MSPSSGAFERLGGRQREQRAKLRTHSARAAGHPDSIRNERVRPVARYAVQAEVERLQGLFEQRKTRLRDCLARIDRDLLDCRNHLAEYDEIRGELVAASERLTSPDAQPLSLPEFPAPGSLGEMIVQRLQAPRGDEA